MNDDARAAERRTYEAQDNCHIIQAAITVAWWQVSQESGIRLDYTVIEDRVLTLLPGMPADTIAQYRYMMGPT